MEDNQDRRPDAEQGLPVVGIDNGETLELAYAMLDGNLNFSNKDRKDLIGPGAIDPQDAERLLDQMVPVASVTFEEIEDGEYDPNLAGKDGMAIYHQMLSDGTVANALNYLYGAMRSAAWKIEPASTEDQDIEIAAFVADQLGIDDIAPNKYGFGRLFSLFEHSLVYGISVGEIVLAMNPEGKAVLDKIIYINPFVIDEIEFDNQGGPKNYVINGVVRGTGKQILNRKLPIYKTISFVHRDDGTFTGKSMLRAALPHWRVKRALIVLINQGVERFLLGVPIVKVPRNVRPGTKQWSEARNIAKNFVTRPRSGVILPPGWEFEVAKLHVGMPDVRPYLEYHDAGIARALGIDFNTVRQNEGVQNINIQAFVGLTDNTIESLLREFTSTINLYLIPKLVILNWPDVRRYPRLVYDLKHDEEFSASANLMGMVINAALNSIKAGEGQDLSPEQVTEHMHAIMGALPPRFKRALGIQESEMQARLNAYRSGASTGYRRDRRKPLPGG